MKISTSSDILIHVKELVAIELKIEPRNKIQKFFHTIQSKLEDILFFIIQKTPEAFIPKFLMNWLDSYLTKRTQQLQQEFIRQQWRQVYLEKVVEELNIKQDKK